MIATVGPWLGLIGSVLGLVALLGGAYLTVKSGQAQTWKSTADTERANAQAQTARGDRLEHELRDLARRVEVLESENKTLRAMHDHTEKLESIYVGIQSVSAQLSILIASQK